MEKLNISFRFLLSIYLIVPALIAFVLVDVFAFDRLMGPFFSSALLSSFIFLLLFEGPHLYASFLSYFDKEYLSFYRKKLILGLPIVLGIGLSIAYFDRELGVAAMILYTAYHVISQQGGISLLMFKRKLPLYNMWRLSAVGSFAVLYLYALQVKVPSLIGIIFWATCTSVFLALSIYINSTLESGIGRQYFLANVFAVLSTGFFFFTGYIFFSLFVLRFLHDVTAFTFYIAHDRNRNNDSVKNYIYKILSPIKIPIILLVPAVAVSITYLLRFKLHIYDGILYTAIIVTFTHYYLESFMWKRDSLHRKQLSFIT